jgi:hypothetical protein
MLAVNSACRSPRRLIHLIEYKAVLAQRRLFTLLKGRDELLRRQIHAVREVSPARTVRRRPCYMCRRTSAPLCRYIRVVPSNCARVRQLPLIFPTHHPLGTRQHGNIKPSEV